MPDPYTADFLANPLACLGANAGVLNLQGADPSTGRPAVRAAASVGAPVPGGTAFTQSAGVFPRVNVYPVPTPRLPGQPVQAITLEAANVDQRVRYLPDAPNALTQMALDPAAEWVFTGPLSGCHVYVATVAGATVLYHVNDNTSADDIPANKRIKDRRLKNVLPAGALPTHRLIWWHYRSVDAPFEAFAFGRRVGGNWRFWYHRVLLAGAESAHVTAELPPFHPGLAPYWGGL
ncbi:hypothetical protein AB0910_20950 [Streptomyces sp. NPDC047002]|uniref:hypothetical protein n=1 Tax=Streptomyces sp. NPDC047002 TaxID=3155475 RepID=UPI003452349D